MKRVGFLGTGWIGRHRMAAMVAAGDVQAVAVCDPSDDSAAAALAQAPDAVRVASLAEMLALGLDGVVIATPSAGHAAESIMALDAGVAVFCQKPLGRSEAEVAKVLAAARRADRLLGVDLSYRFTSGARAIRDLVRDGRLGQVHAVDLVFHNAYGPDKPWFFDPVQSGGGCVMDLGVHLVDLALWLLGGEARVVAAHLSAGGAPVTPGRCEDFALATLVHGSGAVIRLACSWHLPAGQDAVIGAALYGTAGGAELRNIGGSFYDFAADHLIGTSRAPLARPPEDWGARAACDWARRLAADTGFDPEAGTLRGVARVLDGIYAAGGRPGRADLAA